MLFNSYIFILAFLPCTLVIYFLLNKLRLYKIALIFLAFMSFVFYGYFNVAYIWIIFASITFNYVISRLLYVEKLQKIKKVITIIGIIFNVGLIFYFKYYDFFIENINLLFGTTFELKEILLPLGISFFTFQQISYITDSYRGGGIQKNIHFWNMLYLFRFFRN